MVKSKRRAKVVIGIIILIFIVLVIFLKMKMCIRDRYHRQTAEQLEERKGAGRNGTQGKVTSF